jgi:hypothetical protein
MIKQSVSIPDQKKEKLLDRFLRFGLIAKGVVYCLFGIVAVMTAAGLSREKASKTETLKIIYEQPFGQVVLFLILIGLVGHVILRLFQCFKDSNREGNDVNGIFTRIGYGISALIYAGLASFIVKLLLNDESSGESHVAMVRQVFSWPAGRWLVGIVAAIVIINGIRQGYKGVSGRFMKNITLMKTDLEGLFRKAGVMGYLARGVVLMIIGYLVLHASVTLNPHETKGSEQAFAFIENKFGSLLMGIVALGLVAYGAFMFVKAKYQRLGITLS